MSCLAKVGPWVRIPASPHMIIATHSGRFHADDVFAVATLKIAGLVDQIIRTRNQNELNSADIRLDVGRKNNPETGDYDHHQAGGAGKRPNGIPYASFGLIWQKYGPMVTGSKEAAESIDENLVQIVDADDCGVDLFISKFAGVKPYEVSKIIAQFNPSWKVEPTQEDIDRHFADAVEFASIVLKQEIVKSNGKIEAQRIVRDAIKAARDPRIIILEQYAPWKDVVVTEAPEALYIVHPIWPKVRGQWSVYAVNKTVDSFEIRKSLPGAWAGKEAQDLVVVTGVEDAIFCHSGRHMVIADSKDGALRLAEKALASLTE